MGVKLLRPIIAFTMLFNSMFVAYAFWMASVNGSYQVREPVRWILTLELATSILIVLLGIYLLIYQLRQCNER